MRQSITICLVFFYLISMANVVSALEWRRDWQNAKSQAETEVKKTTSEKVKNLSQIFPWKQKDLGPNLEKYEKIVEEIKAKLTIDDIINQKKFHSYFHTYTKSKSGEENWEFYMQSPKMKYADIYKKWTSTNSPSQINMDGDMFEAWAGHSRDGFRNASACKTLLEKCRVEIKKLMADNYVFGFNKWLLINYKKSDRDKLNVKIADAIKEYRRVVNLVMPSAKWKNNANVQKAGNILLTELKDIEDRLKKYSQ